MSSWTWIAVRLHELHERIFGSDHRGATADWSPTRELPPVAPELTGPVVLDPEIAKTHSELSAISHALADFHKNVDAALAQFARRQLTTGYRFERRQLTAA